MNIEWLSFDNDMPEEDEPVLCLFYGNDVCEFLIMQCSIFEGRFYPDHLNGLIDLDDAVNPLMFARIK